MLWRGLLAFLLGLTLMWGLRPLLAHDHARPELDGWYTGLRSGRGLCCGGPRIDAVTLDGPDWKIVGQHYEVFLEEEWRAVPADAVLREPNRDGRALVWPTHQDGEVQIRCFMPGMLG